MRIVYVLKSLLIAPVCIILMAAYVILGIVFGLSLIIGEPRFLENLTAVFVAVIKASFEEVNVIFHRLVFGV